MSLTRRRFLTISAACAIAPQTALAQTWQGHAFGADVSMTIRGPRDLARHAITQARAAIRRVERQFSLYDPNSALSRLNKTGILREPTQEFVDLLDAANHAYKITNGLFDPSIQPLWLAQANAETVQGVIGWDHVRYNGDQVILGKGQALTFNGIAQGFATDLICDQFDDIGLGDVLVNIGEHRALGGPWTLGLSDPSFGLMGMRTLTSGAIATSSPQASPLGQSGHILHPTARPKWSTVSVQSPRATFADSLSTGLVLADLDQIRSIVARDDVSRITLVDMSGDLITL